MKHLLAPCLVVGLVLSCASAAQAACYADYKAKQDNPLQLHYGVMRLSDGACPGPSSAAQQIASRIAGGGWQLLTVVSVSSNPPTSRQKSNAGPYYLRY